MISTDSDFKSSSRSSPDSSSSSTTKSASTLSNTSTLTTSTSSFLSPSSPSSFHYCQSDSKRIARLSIREGSLTRSPKHERIPLSSSSLLSSPLSSSSHPYLQLISCHLFNRGFTHDFLHSLLQSLKDQQKVSRKTPLQVLMEGDQSILEVSLMSLCFSCWCHDYYFLTTAFGSWVCQDRGLYLLSRGLIGVIHLEIFSRDSHFFETECLERAFCPRFQSSHEVE